MPPLLLRLLLALLAATGTYLHFGTLNGHYAGVSLLVVMLGMKLTEMTTRRDYLLVVYLSYFLLTTHFLFSQELYMMALLPLGAWLITTVLIDINHPQSVLPLSHAGRLSGALVLQAIPLMILFFLLFPRIPGPLWGLPSSSGAAQSGLSNSMEPGGISSLSLSDDIAFRVRFSGAPPGRQQLYWRGPVFQFFNGRQWSPGDVAEVDRPVEIEALGGHTEYEIQLEPHGNKWLLALDLPVAPLPDRSQIDPDLVLRHREDVGEQRLFKLTSATEYRADLNLPPLVRRANLSLPRGSNPRSVELAEGWRAELRDPELIRDAALQMFRNLEFSYTLQPPGLPGVHPMDRFLFETRRGFCEHFASAFTLLMRAAGVPARVVTGYQGAEPNGDYFIVRQSDAHAWSEIWLPQRGWVRVDPTAAVAPDRVELGLGAALPAGEPIPGMARLNRNALLQLQLRWDMINAAWTRWILAYGPDLQRALLSALGLPGIGAAIIALTTGSVAILAVLALWLAYKQRPLAELDPVQRPWRLFQRKLTRAGLAPGLAEGPADLARRVADQRPEWADSVQQISRLYVRLRYAGRQDAQLLQRLKDRVRRFPPR